MAVVRYLIKSNWLSKEISLTILEIITNHPWLLRPFMFKWRHQRQIIHHFNQCDKRLELNVSLDSIKIQLLLSFDLSDLEKSLGDLFQNNIRSKHLSQPRTTDTQWRHKSKISEKLGRCGRKNMLPPYLKIWDWDWIFGRAVKAFSSLGVRSPWLLSTWIILPTSAQFFA